jgi:hypothetical protein
MKYTKTELFFLITSAFGALFGVFLSGVLLGLDHRSESNITSIAKEAVPTLVMKCYRIEDWIRCVNDEVTCYRRKEGNDVCVPTKFVRR